MVAPHEKAARVRRIVEAFAVEQFAGAGSRRRQRVGSEVKPPSAAMVAQFGVRRLCNSAQRGFSERIADSSRHFMSELFATVSRAGITSGSVRRLADRDMRAAISEIFQCPHRGSVGRPRSGRPRGSSIAFPSPSCLPWSTSCLPRSSSSPFGRCPPNPVKSTGQLDTSTLAVPLCDPVKLDPPPPVEPPIT
jgi:hypothetical protein